jgi:transcriptional regulator of acetoin/glycerol metabolism
VDFRLVSASLRELDRLIHEQGFREDLYYRINGMRVVIAPLRERQDIPELIKKLLQQLSPNEPKQLSSEASAGPLSSAAALTVASSNSTNPPYRDCLFHSLLLP